MLPPQRAPPATQPLLSKDPVTPCRRPLGRPRPADPSFTRASAERRGHDGFAHRCVTSAQHRVRDPKPLAEGTDRNPTSALETTAAPRQPPTSVAVLGHERAVRPHRPGPVSDAGPCAPPPAPTPDSGQAPRPGRAPGSRRRPGQPRGRAEGGGDRKLGLPFRGQPRGTKPKGRGTLDPRSSRCRPEPAGERSSARL